MIERESTQQITVTIDGEDWKPAESLSEAGADDKVFVVDRATGRVVFGDGTHGRRPPNDSTVTISYREGGGTEGNTAVSITARWPPADRRYVIAVSSAGIRINAIGGEVDRFAGAKRLTYFNGQLLDASAFRTEQQYLLGRRYLHNRVLHGFGIASGLSVTVAVNGSSASVVIDPGLALDRRGREVELGAALTLPLGISACPRYVIIEYLERETDPVPSLVEGAGVVASRIEEGACIRLSDEAVTDDGVVLARLLPETTGWKDDGDFEPARCNRPRP